MYPTHEAGRLLSSVLFQSAHGKVCRMIATKALRVRVDRERCQGHARCLALAPERFDRGDGGNARELGDGTVAPALEAKARLAQSNCPELAIDVVEELRNEKNAAGDRLRGPRR